MTISSVCENLCFDLPDEPSTTENTLDVLTFDEEKPDENDLDENDE